MDSRCLKSLWSKNRYRKRNWESWRKGAQHHSQWKTSSKGSWVTGKRQLILPSEISYIIFVSSMRLPSLIFNIRWPKCNWRCILFQYSTLPRISSILAGQIQNRMMTVLVVSDKHKVSSGKFEWLSAKVTWSHMRYGVCDLIHDREEKYHLLSIPASHEHLYQGLLNTEERLNFQQRRLGYQNICKIAEAYSEIPPCKALCRDKRSPRRDTGIRDSRQHFRGLSMAFTKYLRCRVPVKKKLSVWRLADPKMGGLGGFAQNRLDMIVIVNTKAYPTKRGWALHWTYYICWLRGGPSAVVSLIWLNRFLETLLTICFEYIHQVVQLVVTESLAESVDSVFRRESDASAYGWDGDLSD